MPDNPQKIIAELAAKAERITKAIDARQSRLDRAVYQAERDLFALIVQDYVGRLTIRDGVVEASATNLQTLAALDVLFDRFQATVNSTLMPEFVDGLFGVVAMTGELYAGMAAEQTLNAIAADNTVIRAAIGIDNTGSIIRGTALWDISTSAPVRDGLKQVVLRGIQGGNTLRDFTKAIRDYIVGTPNITGRLQSYYRTYAYDLFNQVQEAKNEQFRRGLDLQWFIYSGSIIDDTRTFCAKKAGKIFAVQEADAEWPNDPDLIGRTSGIPYNPRIDRGRWNCRHRIRYITEETAAEIDPAKVKRIKQKYG